MPTFNVGVAKNDIQAPILLPEDWYLMEIVKDPVAGKNNAWKEAGENLSLREAGKINPKAGENIILHLKVISDAPEENGRMFTKWLSLPNELDEGLFTNKGQPKADWKADNIFKWVEAFGGSAEGAEVSMAQGQKALVYVIVEKDRDEESDVNGISMNMFPRKYEGSGTGLSADEGSAGLGSGLL